MAPVEFEGATGVAIGTLTPAGDPIVHPVAGTLTGEFSWTAEGRMGSASRNAGLGRSPFNPASPHAMDEIGKRASARRGSRPGNFAGNQNRCDPEPVGRFQPIKSRIGVAEARVDDRRRRSAEPYLG